MARASGLLLLAIACANHLTAGEPPPAISLRRVLSAEEFERAGLAKLTPAELSALESALASHGHTLARNESTAATSSPKTSKPNARQFGEEQVRTPVEQGTELRSRIDGAVTDLTGRSVFVLENGQVWQQRIPDKHPITRPLTNPAVIITRGLGGYKMDIEGLNWVVFVKRIQ